MQRRFPKRPLAISAAVAALLISGAWAIAGGTGVLGGSERLNPCAATNPCARGTNPCARGTNPCARGTNPCARGTNPCAKGTNPCGAKSFNPCAGKALNPCGANPCAAKTVNPCVAMGNPCGGTSVDAAKIRQPVGVTLASAPPEKLVELGERLWNDRMLRRSGLACSSCHIGDYAQMQPTFAEPYPHRVAMPAQQAGLQQVNAAEMVQFCMAVPMMAEPFDWASRELAALVAYVESIQPGYRPVSTGVPNPCNPSNPCAAKGNPCSMTRSP